MIHTAPSIQYVAIQMDNGTEALMGFVTRGQSPTLPFGATWENPLNPWTWVRPANDANLFAEVMKACPKTDANGVAQPQPTGYARISHDERAVRWAKNRKAAKAL